MTTTSISHEHAKKMRELIDELEVGLGVLEDVEDLTIGDAHHDVVRCVNALDLAIHTIQTTINSHEVSP